MHSECEPDYNPIHYIKLTAFLHFSLSGASALRLHYYSPAPRVKTQTKSAIQSPSGDTRAAPKYQF